MTCMKCGRDIEEGQVFCTACLADMAKYPVKPNIAIQLPHRKEGHTPKKGHPKRRQNPKPEDKLQSMKKWIRFLLVMWLLTLTLLAATIYPTVEFFLGESFHLPGQNYTTISDLNATQP